MTRQIYVLFFVCLLKTSFQKSTPADDSYVAAVIEYRHVANTTVNLQNYLQHIGEAASQSADIVVFPEMTLQNGRSPVTVPIYGALKEFPIPALRPALYDDILVQLSAAAAEHQVYLVVNVIELLNCSTNPTGEACPERQKYQFNTNVVFDRSGAVISRYRKINLFGEASRTPALNPDLGVFSTDFGVTFGHFICFDLMFQVPAVQVVQKNNITDVVFTTMWFSELPFLTAVQIQEAYAYAMNVNLLASGANNVRVGSAGSGIYSGKAGALVSTMPGMPATRLMVSRVPKVPGKVTWPTPGPIVDPPSDADALRLKQDPSIASHASRLLTPGFQEFELSQNDVTCKFKVNLTRRGGDKGGPEFRAMVHGGSNTYARRKIGTRSCAVMACASADDVTLCGSRYNQTEDTTIIEELKIKMTTAHVPYNTTLDCENAVFFPNTVQNNHLPLEPSNYTLIIKTYKIHKHTKHAPKKTKKQVKAIMRLHRAHDNLVSFAIWSRNYLEDVNLRGVQKPEGVELAVGEGAEYVMDNVGRGMDL
ncbi:vanin-like protein 2 isoform X1 [Plutella xylostella]|uniref:vanin-like protein 2 isoform X1 n=1 Tax=Plutella xylostella TaxID=51655 RepID=UPI00203291FC|nr:vanin-like protein 2 isoform X1 [Plutella xylostella]